MHIILGLKSSFYYGIVFLFLYETIFRIFERLITTLVVYLSWNIHIIYISLAIIAISMLVFFFTRKSIPKINIWGIITIIICFVGVSLIAPEKWLNSTNYSPAEIVILSSTKTIIMGCFTWILVIIAYIKYYKINHHLKTEDKNNHSAVVTTVDKEGNTTTITGKMGQGEISTNHPDAPNYYKKDSEGNKTSRAYFRIFKVVE
jgi:hypothetical protein